MITSEIIGKEIIGETSRGIFGLLSGISEFDIPYINMIFEDLDIMKTIELVESLFQKNREPKCYYVKSITDFSIKQFTRYK